MSDIAIETERLVLRRWREADRGPFAAMNADPEVMRYFPAVRSREQSDAFADRISAHFDEHGLGLFVLEEKDGSAFVGFTGFQTVAMECPVKGELEIGWRLARDYWRRGLAFEAASACFDWIDRNGNASRIVSFSPAISAPSKALMTKLGMTHRFELDFDHPTIDSQSPINRHIVYVKDPPL